jgi:cyclopropane-fatty-acyl-phospholipid synthase
MSTTPAADTPLSMRLLESDRIPDWLIRRRIRALLAQRLSEEDKGGPEAQQAHLMRLVHQLRESPIAINTAEANAQHYEVPTGFYLLALGRHLKYSSCLYESFDIRRAAADLDSAEARMLELTCARAPGRR